MVKILNDIIIDVNTKSKKNLIVNFKLLLNGKVIIYFNENNEILGKYYVNIKDCMMNLIYSYNLNSKYRNFINYENNIDDKNFIPDQEDYNPEFIGLNLIKNYYEERSNLSVKSLNRKDLKNILFYTKEISNLSYNEFTKMIDIIEKWVVRELIKTNDINNKRLLKSLKSMLENVDFIHKEL